MEAIPWYRTLTFKIGVGAGVVVLLVAGLYGLAAVGILPKFWVTNPDQEAHYDELERHRAAQRENPPAPPADNAPAPATPATASPALNPASAPATASSGAPKAAANRWTDYRGLNRDGRYEESTILTNWPSGKLRELWRAPIGGGWASFVAADGVAFTIEQRRSQEVVAAYELATGKEVWTHSWDAEFKESESMGGDGPRATPTWNEGRIYALGAKGELRCLEAQTGRRIWSRNILSDNGASNLEWGMSGAPLVVDDKVIVQPGGTSGKSIVAYNKNTGERVWTALNDRQAYVSPMLVTVAGNRHILTITSTRVVGLNIADGSLIWEYPWQTSMGINCSQPIVVAPNRVFISSGYGKGAAVVELTANGSALTAQRVWENTSIKNKFNSSVFHNGYVYGFDEGILTCVDVANGERKWKGGRYGFGQLVLANGHLVITTEEGEVVLVKATPDQHTEVAKFSALEGRTWNVPVIVNGRLLVRNATHMVCYDIQG